MTEEGYHMDSEGLDFQACIVTTILLVTVRIGECRCARRERGCEVTENAEPPGAYIKMWLPPRRPYGVVWEECLPNVTVIRKHYGKEGVSRFPWRWHGSVRVS